MSKIILINEIIEKIGNGKAIVGVPQGTEIQITKSKKNVEYDEGFGQYGNITFVRGDKNHCQKEKMKFLVNNWNIPKETGALQKVAVGNQSLYAIYGKGFSVATDKMMSR